MIKTRVLDINFDVVDIKSVLDEIFDSIRESRKKFIVTANPEIVMLAQKDIGFKKIINKADLVLADGIGIVLASKLNKKKINKRIAGYDLVQEIFLMNEKKGREDLKVYFLGSGDKIVEKAKKNIEERYKKIKVVGVNNGFFDDKREIIEKINLLKPDILLVGMGAPKQEKFIFENKEIIDAKIFIGVGGSFDVMAGKIKRAPKIMIDLNLEWFYRFIKEPKRFWRLMVLPKFLLKVIGKKILGE